jgi:hypothetical protein
MSGIFVRDKYAFRRSLNDKWFGQSANIMGRPLFVVPSTAAGNFSVGSWASWARDNNQLVFDTMNLAFAQVQDGRGDAVVLLPGTHTLTANIAWSKSQVQVYGPESWIGLSRRMRPSAKLIPIAGSAGLTLTGADVTFNGVEFVPITAQNFCSFSAAAARLRLLNCYLDMETPAVNVATQGFVATGAAPHVHVSGCTFISGGAQGFALGMVAATPFLIEDSDFLVSAGTWAAAVKTGAGSVGLVRRNYFGGQGTSITGLASTGAAEATNSIRLNDNRVGVGHVLASGYGGANAKCVLANNFIETVSGGTGGTLVTIST